MTPESNKQLYILSHSWLFLAVRILACVCVCVRVSHFLAILGHRNLRHFRSAE